MDGLIMFGNFIVKVGIAIWILRFLGVFGSNPESKE